MRWFIAIVLTMWTMQYAGAELDDYYYNYDEIAWMLDSLSTHNADIMRVDTVGYSSVNELPILAAVVSDQVNTVEDEPAVFINGLCHAEEILGVEVAMASLEELINHRYVMPWSAWIAASQIVIVPEMNPDGLGVVLSGEDITYRKNLTPIGGECIINPGIGNDSCGVDLNRNYDIFWNHGDTLWHDQDAEAFDYYRGPAPFSEPEMRAMRDLGEQYPFVYTIQYHSARTSNNFQHVIFPWGWKDPDNESQVKPCPDINIMTSVGEGIASSIPKLDGSAYYDPVLGSGRKGSAPNYFYWRWGTLSYLIEVGTNENGGAFQPEDEAVIDQICDDNLQGIHWMMNRLIGYQMTGAMLQGHVTDAQSGLPLVAKVEIMELTSSEIHPRYSRQPFGRFYRPVSSGYYTLRVTKPGYEVWEQNVAVNQQPTNYEVQLQPVSWFELSGNLFSTSSEEPVDADLMFYNLTVDTVYTCSGSGQYDMELPNGDYRITTRADGYVSVVTDLTLSGDEDVQYNIGLPDVDTVIPLPVNSLDGWVSDGAGAAWSVVSDDSTAAHLVESPTLYSADDMDATLTRGPISLDGFHHASLHLSHSVDIEDEYDYAEVQVSDGGDWQVLDRFSGHDWYFHDRCWNLDDYTGGDLYVRLRFVTDGWVTDEGWHIRSLEIRASSHLNDVPKKVATPVSFKITGNYPNPFNPTTTIEYELPAPVTDNTVTLEVFDITGNLVDQLRQMGVMAGQQKLHYRPQESMASGVYFYHLRTGERSTGMSKMLFVK